MENSLPQHVAIIMDGNGRWANQRGKPRLEGHRAGVENIHQVIDIFAEYKVKYLTLFAFSTENWNRPQNEVRGLVKLLAANIDREVKSAHEKGIQIRHLGRLDRLPMKLQQKIKKAVELTKNNTRGTICVAFDYGGRDEIIEAALRIAADNVSPEDVNESLFRQYLYAPDIPDPDMIIRTGGEMRLSNFLLWEAAYSELYFTEVLWPDFDRTEIEKALATYASRQRRFGEV